VSAAAPRSKAPAGITPIRRYLWTLASLLVLLALTAGTALLKLGSFNTILSLAISVAKTVLVMLIFMHETEGRRLTQIASVVGFIWLAMLIGFTLCDFLTRVTVPAPW
jgi:cytochrome c oxidase subunit 4